MSGDELQLEFQQREKREDEEFAGNMDAIIELNFGRFQARFEEEMHWRVKRIIENAYRTGVRAVAQSDIGWTPICNKCGEEVQVLGVTKYECKNGCHEGKKHLGY